ncbi:MAG: Decaprenyl-phosphate N-acetylglucosaminephosphotransferase [Legionellaceae bacterium]
MNEYYLLMLLLFIISVLLTGAIRFYALCHAIMDIPNERSSHHTPTPRGGGLAIAITFFLGIGVLIFQKKIPSNLGFALLIPGFIIAAIGFLDDCYHISIFYRLIAHFTAAIVSLYYLDIHSVTVFGPISIHITFLHKVFLIFIIVWFINLYNFMDGIDGLASSEALFVCLAISLLLKGIHISFICGILIAAVSGFLIWNWPPAKIFMGDVSSSLLGFIFGILSIYTASQHYLTLTTWFILLAIFIADASFTLIRRILAREKWYTPHRSHAYQRLIHYGFSHQKVTLMLMAFNIGILFPLALLSIQYLTWNLGLGLLAYVICIFIWRQIVNKIPI